jgi:hypothetical protein
MTDEPTTPEPTDPPTTEPTMPEPPSDGPMEPMAAPAGPSRAWIWIAGGLIAAVVAVVAVVSLTGGNDESSTTAGSSSVSAEDGSFSGHGVSFDYPSDWQDFGPPTFQVASGDVQWSESFGASIGSSGAIVTEYALKKDVGSVSEADLQAELDQLFTSTVAQANGELIAPLAPTTVNGMPGYMVSFTSTTGGIDLTTDMVLIFQGTQQWNIQCQYTAEEQQSIRPGCEQIWNSFTVGG